MSLLMDLRPNRWIRSCLEDGSAFDYCGALGMGDFIPRAWGIDASDNNALLILKVIPDPNGLIASVDTFPNATLYNPDGVSGSILSMTSSSTVFGTTTYNYTPLLDTGAGRDIVGLWSVQILGMQVTLVTGDVCSVNFNQSFVGGDVVVAWNFTTTKQTGLTLIQRGGSGSVEWASGNIEFFNATASSVTLTKTYATAGTRTVNVRCAAADVDEIDLAGENLTAMNLSKLTGLTFLKAQTNTALTSVLLPATSAALMDTFWLFSTGVSSVNLNVFPDLRGDVRLQNNASLTSVTFPTNSNAFTVMTIFSTGVTSLNFSTLTGLGGNISIYSNSSLTSVTNPVSSQAVTVYHVYSCNLNALDVSGFSALSGSFRCNTNANLATLTLPTSAGVFTLFYAYLCNLSTLDLSTLSGLAGDFRAYQNPNLTSVTFPATASTFTVIMLFSCNLSTLDISMLTGLSGTIRIEENSNLNSLTLPASSGTVTLFHAHLCNLPHFDITGMTFASTIDFRADSNGMTAGEVNEMLVDLNATLPGVGTGTIQLHGTNAAPDTTSGGFNGSAAKTSLQGKGYTVTTN